jgi:hypothetical protein
MSLFTLGEEDIALQQGAWAAGKRKIVYWGAQAVAGFTQGAFRNYLYPVFSPKGFAVTSESPADHPHHHSLWIGADHVNLHVPAAGAVETYIYNFYVNDVFQGRAPGVIAEVGMHHAGLGDTLAVYQDLEWRGPREWAAPQGRLVLREQRATLFRFLPDFQAFQIDVESAISAPTHDASIGPTRHSWFNARVGPGMSKIQGGDCLADSQARWQDCTGPVGGGHLAGITLAPRSGVSTWSWYVTPWGVMTANPCKDDAISVAKDAEPVKFLARYLVHDGVMGPETLNRLMAAD